MRMMIFFDLPTKTPVDRRNYNRFRKMLKHNGFLMMQESVYCKLLANTTAEKAAAALIHKNKPPSGIVQMLTITEKQFAKMEWVVGEFKTDIINTDERIVEL